MEILGFEHLIAQITEFRCLLVALGRVTMLIRRHYASKYTEKDEILKQKLAIPVGPEGSVCE